MDEFSYYMKKSLDFKKRRDEREKEISKNKLIDASKKKVQTTMIGAISSVEKFFGFLWEQPSPQQEELHKLFQELRSEVLDRGNTQIRNLENEFTNYEIVWKKYNINLPFKGQGEQGK
jgi:hypothetical protein